MTQPLADIEAEALRVLVEASERGLSLRLLGGLAIRLQADGAMHPAFARTYQDIDVVVNSREGRDAGRLLSELGYEAETRFNAAHGSHRMLFLDPGHGRQLDVFVGGFSMCHALPIADRLTLDARTIPLAELLLTKLQIVELNAKDQRDILALLHHRAVGAASGQIDATFIGSLCSADWGLWRTVTMNLERTRASLAESGLSDAEAAVVERRLQALTEALDHAPKSRRWRMRERVGDRVRWYEEPEDHLA